MSPEIELIDTQWNVNKRITRGSINRLNRINRYIVECKCLNSNHTCCTNLELIDTQWNVNRKSGNVDTLPVIELIDTQWNVNIHPTDFCHWKLEN